MKAIVVEQPGGPEALQYKEVPTPELAAEQVLVRVAAIGVNFIDVYHRKGFYPQPLPFTPGSEFSGTIEAVGAQVEDLKVGQRVATASGVGAYAEHARAPADKCVLIPDGIDDRTAAALMLQGMTAHYLTLSTRPLQPGMSCLVHAAAGGVGLLLCQIAKLRGARVIATVSTEEKAKLARAAGADDVVLYTKEDVVPRVKAFTDGKGVDVVYDGVGKTTIEQSLASLAPRGLLNTFGQSSGPVPPIDPLALNKAGSLFLTRPTLAHYIATRAELTKRADDLFSWVKDKRLQVRVGATFPLAHAADAHRALEGRQTTGKVLLIP
jgi:NADPH2:quinone reductase